MDIQQYRGEIDEIDREMVRLFEKRMTLVSQIAACKRASGLPLRDEARERELLAAVRSALPDEWKDYGNALFQTILSLSRDWQERLAPRSGGAEAQSR